MRYLQEHVDTILRAVRHSEDLIRGRASWETTAWVRSMSDAVRLSQMLQDAVFQEADKAGSEATVGLVRARADGGGDPSRPAIRWGVLVRLGRCSGT